jgi:hypothetical protein
MSASAAGRPKAPNMRPSSTVLCFLAIFSTPCPLFAGEVAIARCNVKGVVSIGHGQTTEDAAADAVTNCLSEGGIRHCCQPVITTKQNRCIALAVGPLGKFDTGDTGEKRTAEWFATMRCTLHPFIPCPTGGCIECKLVASICRD